MNGLTDIEARALVTVAGSDLSTYTDSLETFFFAMNVSPKQIEDISKSCKEISDALDNVKITYFEFSLPTLQRLKRILELLIMRKKAAELGYPNLDTLFSQNLEILKSFFSRFNMTSEELSNAVSIPPCSDEDKRPLPQRILNPNYDDSKEFKTMIKGMVKTSKTQYESNEDWANLASAIKGEYEGNHISNSSVEPISELFLEGVKNLREREAKNKLREDKVQKLSLTAEEENREQSRKKLDELLRSVSDSILNGTCKP
jgi:hypothetical protein